MAFIYKITNDVNEKVYIGKTLRSVEKRWKEHIKDSKREHTENRPLYRAMNKYGIDNFHIETIEECSDELVEEREVFWIKEYNSFGKNGYNATIGGDGKSYVDKLLIYTLWLKGMTTNEIQDSIGCCKDIILDSLKFYGVTSKEIKNRRLTSMSKPVDMYNMCGDFIASFSSVKDAYQFLGVKQTSGHIDSVCQGKRKSAYGYKWKRPN